MFNVIQAQLDMIFFKYNNSLFVYVICGLFHIIGPRRPICLFARRNLSQCHLCFTLGFGAINVDVAMLPLDATVCFQRAHYWLSTLEIVYLCVIRMRH